MKRPVLVIIRDGWGYRKEKMDNAIAAANTPNTDYLMSSFPNILLDASGEAVGLPAGYQGNSEEGHTTIGSGRIIEQPMVKIHKSIDNGEFFSNGAFIQAIENCKRRKSVMHIIGLLQEAGVHAHEKHLYALIDLCTMHRLPEVYLHIITDGRDAPSTDAAIRLHKLEMRLSGFPAIKVATISGRYYAMDRDNRWERTRKAYDAIALGAAPLIQPLEECYLRNETDEFMIPRKAPWYNGMQDGDSVIFCNFRTDRPRQLTQAIVEMDFNRFSRQKKDVCFVAMTQYYEPMGALVAFPKQGIMNTLGEILSRNRLRQLRISETEKYAHVTFFFNCQNEKPFLFEDRVMINSPNVATYDLKPEMSAHEITGRVLTELDKGFYDVVIMNIVNGDMVGHTGVVDACIKAVETVDGCVGKIAKKVLDKDGVCLVFGDHGNVEDQTPQWRTSHTINPVPFILVSKTRCKLKENGGLKDIAPTVLHLLELPKPSEMTGESLITQWTP